MLHCKPPSGGVALHFPRQNDGDDLALEMSCGKLLTGSSLQDFMEKYDMMIYDQWLVVTWELPVAQRIKTCPEFLQPVRRARFTRLSANRQTNPTWPWPALRAFWTSGSMSSPSNSRSCGSWPRPELPFWIVVGKSETPQGRTFNLSITMRCTLYIYIRITPVHTCMYIYIHVYTYVNYNVHTTKQYVM